MDHFSELAWQMLPHLVAAGVIRPREQLQILDHAVRPVAVLEHHQVLWRDRSFVLLPQIAVIHRPHLRVAEPERLLTGDGLTHLDAQIPFAVGTYRADRYPVLGRRAASPALLELRLLHAAGVPAGTPQPFVRRHVAFLELRVFRSRPGLAFVQAAGFIAIEKCLRFLETKLVRLRVHLVNRTLQLGGDFFGRTTRIGFRQRAYFSVGPHLAVHVSPAFSPNIRRAAVPTAAAQRPA